MKAALVGVVVLVCAGTSRASDPPVGVRDTLGRLAEALAMSDKAVTEKVDAFYLAAVGRFATAGEQKLAKERYGDRPTADQLRELLDDIVKTPEFVAHAKAILKRAPGVLSPPLRPLASRPFVPPPGALPLRAEGPGGVAPIVGYYVPVEPRFHWTGWPGSGSFSNPLPRFIPNPKMLPLTPWYPPGSSVPLPRLDRPTKRPQARNVD